MEQEFDVRITHVKLNSLNIKEVELKARVCEVENKPEQTCQNKRVATSRCAFLSDEHATPKEQMWEGISFNKKTAKRDINFNKVVAALIDVLHA